MVCYPFDDVEAALRAESDAVEAALLAEAAWLAETLQAVHAAELAVLDSPGAGGG